MLHRQALTCQGARTRLSLRGDRCLEWRQYRWRRLRLRAGLGASKTSEGPSGQETPPHTPQARRTRSVCRRCESYRIRTTITGSCQEVACPQSRASCSARTYCDQRSIVPKSLRDHPSICFQDQVRDHLLSKLTVCLT